MEHAVRPARQPLHGAFAVPPSKSLHQRILVLDHLADEPVRYATSDGLQPPAEDVCRLQVALQRLGRWERGALGAGRESLRLDLGMNGTGLRFGLAAATLRPDGARTLLGGRPRLLARPHGPLLRALKRQGARIKRRHSGALRVLGGGLRGGAVDLDARLSSQFASALLLVAPRVGGLHLRLHGRAASLPYLRLTLDALTTFGVPWEATGLESEDGRIEIAAGAPAATAVRLEPDASAAAAWWAAAALTGGQAWIPGLGRDSRQADVALLALLERMGAVVDEGPAGSARVRGPAGGLQAVGEVDLRDSPDLVFLVGVLAAVADGETVIRGVSHTRGKESDRVAVLARGLAQFGARVQVGGDDVVQVRGGGLRGGRVAVAGDHRAAFAFGILGLRVPGVVLAGAEAVGKSHPRFLADLDGLAGDRSEPRSHG